MFSTGDAATLNMSAVKEKSDLVIDGGTSMTLLRQEIAALLVE
jgi:hypothetical protein